MRPMTVAIVPLVAFLAGCDTTIDVSGYDTRCVAATDCVSVPIGDVCDHGCQQGAINASEQDDYQDEVDALLDQCGPSLSHNLLGACAPAILGCDSTGNCFVVD